jgi:adenosylhomocysteinase
VRRFAAATNLLIAGRTFAIVGEGPRADALRTLLTAIGAREDAAPDYTFDVDGRVLVDGDEPPARADATSRIAWARRFMPVSAALAAEFAESGLLDGIRVGVSMVLEPKTAVLALLLRDAGAVVDVFSHPDETDDAVADALRAEGIDVYARAGADAAEHRALAEAFLRQRPGILVDDGSHVIRLAHELDLLDGVLGATEETTSGLRPLRLMAAEGELRIPVIAANDARSKTSFDNRYGTGQSCVFTILDLVGVDAAGLTLTVAGFGPVGEGVAHHARALGAEVVVAELDPVRELQARFAGYRTAALTEAVATADIVISATGVRDTISAEVLAACAPGAAVAVAGGVEQEVAIDAVMAAGATRETVGRKLERVTLAGGTSILLLDDGGCINVTAGEGNPIEIMDLSFAVQLSAIRLLLESGGLAPGVHPLPARLDDRVAQLALGGSAHDRPRPDPLNDWHTTRFEAHA